MFCKSLILPEERSSAYILYQKLSQKTENDLKIGNKNKQWIKGFIICHLKLYYQEFVLSNVMGCLI